MSRTEPSADLLEAWARARGLELGGWLRAAHPALESLLARLRAMGETLPAQAAPPPDGPSER